MKKLRLLITKECRKACRGCCNKDWDLDSLPIAQDDEYSQYDEILITGGEPMLFYLKLKRLLIRIKDKAPNSKLYMYTARINYIDAVIDLLQFLDGITVTLHSNNQKETLYFKQLCEVLNLYSDYNLFDHKSLRLNIFKGVELNFIPKGWIIKKDIEWIDNCPLPEGEAFKRIENLFTINRRY